MIPSIGASESRDEYRVHDNDSNQTKKLSVVYQNKSVDFENLLQNTKAMMIDVKVSRDGYALLKEERKTSTAQGGRNAPDMASTLDKRSNYRPNEDSEVRLRELNSPAMLKLQPEAVTTGQNTIFKNSPAAA